MCNKWARGNAEIGPRAIPSTLASLELGATVPRGESVSGVVLPYDQVPAVKSVCDLLPSMLGNKAATLRAEVNFYGPEYGADSSRMTRQEFKKCGISWHGDSERPDVVGVVVGSTSKELRFQAFQGERGQTPVGDRVVVRINSGDIYCMDEVACGHKWNDDKKRCRVHYQHASGSVGGNKHTAISS